MKKLIIISTLILMPFIASAQRGISRSNNVSVSSTIVTKTAIEPKTYEAKVGFQQMAGVNVGALQGNGSLGLTYIGGYRFNDIFFIGGGLEYNRDWFGYNQFILPFFAHVRTYFSKRIWRPYASLSLGGYLGNLHYLDEALHTQSGFYADFSFGVDAKLTEKLNMFMALGVNNKGFLFKTGVSF